MVVYGGGGGQWLGGGWLLTEFVYGDPPLLYICFLLLLDAIIISIEY